MKLITADIAKKLFKADQAFIEAADGVSPDEIVAKFFNPCGSGTWYIVQGTFLDKDGQMMDTHEGYHDIHMYGRCDLMGDGGELGYVMLSELQSVKLRFGMGIERDRGYKGKLSELTK